MKCMDKMIILHDYIGSKETQTQILYIPFNRDNKLNFNTNVSIFNIHSKDNHL